MVDECPDLLVKKRRGRLPPTPPPCSDAPLSGIHAASIPYGRTTERIAKQCATILVVLCYTEMAMQAISGEVSREA